jgi:Tol biopolymer transport system component
MARRNLIEILTVPSSSPDTTSLLWARVKEKTMKYATISERSIRVLPALVLAAVLSGSLARGQKNDQTDVMFQAAFHKQLVDGDLEAAIQQYKTILAKYGSDRAVAAKAWLEMGQCYEKLGKEEARKAYERVLRDYADQSEAAAKARARLTALAGNGASRSSEMATRRIWVGPDLDVENCSVSPDGRYLSYVDWTTGDLAIRDLVTGNVRHLTHNTESSGNAFFSAISPDGKEVAYAWYKDGAADLRLAGLDGSEPRVLFSNKEVGALPTDWSPDGKYVLSILVGTGNQFATQIALISVADGSVSVLKTFDRSWPGKMRFSPDGRYIAYDYPPQQESDNRDIFLLAADGSREISLIEHPAEDELLGWTPDGDHILFASDRSGSMGAWMIRVTDGKPLGSPELVKQDIGQAQSIGFTRSGSYYYALEIGTTDIYTAEFDPAAGRVVTQPQKATQRFVGWNFSPTWSPDGQFLAYLSSRRQGLFEHEVISIRSLKTGEERDLSPNLSELWEPIRWSPDGRSILVPGKDKKIQHGPFLVDAQTGEVKSTLHPDPDSDISNAAWFPDGKRLVYTDTDGESGTITETVVMRDLETGRKTELFRPVPGLKIDDIALSADGRQVALTLLEKATRSSVLKVLPVAGGEASELVRATEPETIVGDSLSWSPDSRYIVFGKGRSTGQEQKTELLAISSRGGEPHPLGLSMDSVRRVSFDPSGHHIAFAAGRAKSEVWVMENFLPTLKAAR